MEALRIEATKETPKVTLDPMNNVFEFMGKSLLEDATTFYSPVLEWLDAYGKSPNDHTVIDFKFIYLNNSSSKLILDILFKLEKFTEKGVNISVRWNFHDGDEVMKEVGEEFGDLVEMPFELQNSKSVKD